MSRWGKTTGQLLEEIQLAEAIKGLENKAKKSGMPYSILKKVYDRGMAAWKGGHRPGATQQQWAFARVNSFVTKSSGTWGGADKDLAAKVRGSKKEDLEKDDEKQVKDVIKGLKKASGLHAKQAKSLEKQISDEVELEESSWEKNKNILPPHLKKLFDKDGNLKNPKSQAVFDKMIKDAGGPAGFIKKHKLREDISEAGPCWKGFKQVGMKKKGGKMVPNCVPTEDTDYDFKVLDLEDLDENLDVRYDIKKQGWFDKQGKRRYLGIGQTNALMKKALDKAKRTGDFINPFKMTHGQKAEDLDAQPQDKDVKKVKGTQPKKYYKDLKKDTKKKRADFFKNRPDYKKSDDDDDYKAAPGDKTAKTKPSTFTKKFKKMYGEEILNEFTAAQIKTLEREYAPLKGRTMSTAQLNKMTGMIKKMTKDQLNKLAQASIPFVTSTAKSELVINRGMKWTDFKESMKMKNPFKPKEKGEDKDAKIDKLEKENQMLKVKAELEKAVEPNPDTGEVPLKVGLAQKILKDMKSGKKIKMKEKDNQNLKGVGTGKTKIEIDPKMNISPSAGGDAQATSN